MVWIAILLACEPSYVYVLVCNNNNNNNSNKNKPFGWVVKHTNTGYYQCIVEEFIIMPNQQQPEMPTSPDNQTVNTISTVGTAFYQTLQGEIEALRGKVDQQLTDMVTKSTFEMENLSKQLLDMQKLSEDDEDRTATEGTREPRSPGSLRQQASPRNRRHEETDLAAKQQKADGKRLRRKKGERAWGKLTKVLSTPSSGSSTYIQQVVSNDVTEPTNNLTRTAPNRRRNGLDKSISSLSSSTSASSLLPVVELRKSDSEEAHASPSWGNHKMKQRINEKTTNEAVEQSLDQITEEKQNGGSFSESSSSAQQEESSEEDVEFSSDDYQYEEESDYYQQTSEAIVVTKASSSRRAAAYEHYRTLDQQKDERRPWRQGENRQFSQYSRLPEEESALIQLLSEDTSTAQALSGNEGETPTPKSSSRSRANIEGDSEKRKQKPRRPTRFFPDDENDNNGDSDKSTEETGSMQEQESLYKSPETSSVSELTTQGSASESNHTEVIQRKFFDPISERRRPNHERSVAELAMNPRRRDAPENVRQMDPRSGGDDPSDADGKSTSGSVASSRAGNSIADCNKTRSDAPCGTGNGNMSACSGIGNEYTLPSGSWTYSSAVTKPDLSGKVVMSTDGSVPSTLTDTETRASSDNALVVVSKGSTYPGAPSPPPSPRQEEKMEDETAVTVRTDDRVVRLEQVDGKTLRDPYGDYGVFTGIIVQGKPHGQGSMTYADGRTYIGEWKHGRWNGHGKTTFSNGDVYRGQYEMDKRHGVGRYEWKDGRIYDGDFVCDQREGNGTYSFPDGSVYIGGFRAGLRHGQGCYRFSDSSVFNGEFQDGKYHGVGECVWSDGRCYRGEWSDGRAHGYGVEIRADGTIRHEGEWKADRPVRKKKKKSEKHDPPPVQKESGVAAQKSRTTKKKKQQTKQPQKGERKRSPDPPAREDNIVVGRPSSKYALDAEPKWSRKIRSKKKGGDSSTEGHGLSPRSPQRTLIRD